MMILGSELTLCRQGMYGVRGLWAQVDEVRQDAWIRLSCNWFGRKSAVHPVWFKVQCVCIVSAIWEER